MADKTKSQPNRAIEIYVGGKSIVKAIGNISVSTDRPLTDVNAYAMRFPNATIAGTQTYELSIDIPGDADTATIYKQLLQSFFDPDGADLDALFAAGGIFHAELPHEDILDNIPIVVVAQGLDTRLLETGTPITDLLRPFVSEVYYGMTVRQLLSVLDLGEAHFKRNVTLKPLMKHALNGPVAIDVFGLPDKNIDLSPEECAFLLTYAPLRLIDGQFCFIMVNNEVWHKGFWYDAANGLLVFDQDNGYCPGYATALFLREEQTVVATAVTLDNEPMANGLIVTNEFDTEKYIAVAAAPAVGEYTIAAGGVLGFNAGDNGEVIHADYFHQGPNVPFKNITVIYVITNPGIRAGDPFAPMTGALI